MDDQVQSIARLWQVEKLLLSPKRKDCLTKEARFSLMLIWNVFGMSISVPLIYIAANDQGYHAKRSGNRQREGESWFESWAIGHKRTVARTIESLETRNDNILPAAPLWLVGGGRRPVLYLQKLGPDCDRPLQRLILIEIEIISEEDLIQQSGGEKVQIITFAYHTYPAFPTN